MAFSSGATLGVYRISGLLGKGGMGEVYRARDEKLERDVALKVLPQEFARDPDRFARFGREARLLAALSHPNIAGIHGLEESNDTHFLVLELVEGETLTERLGRSLAIEQALKLAIQIATALEAAHAKGIIHRDLKPGNIKIAPDGTVKVLDFGLAKATETVAVAPDLSQSPTLSMTATAHGVILGTAGYMSPEQARGEAVNKQADIWSFGCILFEMLSGRRIWEGRSVTDVIASLVAREPEWKRLPAGLHPRVRFVLERCLEKESANRYHEIADVRVEIAKASPIQMVPRRSLSVRPRSAGRSPCGWPQQSPHSQSSLPVRPDGPETRRTGSRCALRPCPPRGARGAHGSSVFAAGRFERRHAMGRQHGRQALGQKYRRSRSQTAAGDHGAGGAFADVLA